jgi:hypothetical protein
MPGLSVILGTSHKMMLIVVYLHMLRDPKEIRFHYGATELSEIILRIIDRYAPFVWIMLLAEDGFRERAHLTLVEQKYERPFFS